MTHSPHLPFKELVLYFTSTLNSATLLRFHYMFFQSHRHSSIHLQASTGDLTRFCSSLLYLYAVKVTRSEPRRQTLQCTSLFAEHLYTSCLPEAGLCKLLLFLLVAISAPRAFSPLWLKSFSFRAKKKTLKVAGTSLPTAEIESRRM